MKRGSNMYSLSVKQWNPFVGCGFQCAYCKPSFQAQLKRWAKNRCKNCYNFIPHTHFNRIRKYHLDNFPKTRYMQFVFVCSNGDLSFASSNIVIEILNVIRLHPNTNFLIQTKNPRALEGYSFPPNVILGVTLETNRNNTKNYSLAPIPQQRASDFLRIPHKPKMVTIEPVMRFDKDVLISWIKTINPVMVWLGYNSRKNPKLPEPTLAEFKALHFQLALNGYPVILKKVRGLEK